ncbi:hypothetical protein [Vampirovibrio sp.]|uniref:hypothetical protein n=1 Tax=Vampirovibrio sp. TaxID=2717857 RepID=UPI0035943EC6
MAPVKFLALVVSLGVWVGGSTACAFALESLPNVDPAAASTPSNFSREFSPPSLAGLRSFDVFGLEKASFSAFRENVPPEITEYARAALQADTRFEYSSPGQGVLKFECVDFKCNRIRAEVTHGVDGPVLWQTARVYRHCPLIRFSFQPDSKKFAYRMVEQLGRDYQNALKASRVKIEIENQ